MRRSIPHEVLVAKIHEASRLAGESEQLRRRLRNLLPNRLNALKAQHQRGISASLAMRRALDDPEYHAAIEELLETGFAARQARVEMETHRMLHAARQSLRSFARAAIESGRAP